MVIHVIWNDDIKFPNLTYGWRQAAIFYEDFYTLMGGNTKSENGFVQKLENHYQFVNSDFLIGKAGKYSLETLQLKKLLTSF